MCDLGKGGEMELKTRKERGGWCFLMGVNQAMSVCGQIVEEGMWALKRRHLSVSASSFWPF